MRIYTILKETLEKIKMTISALDQKKANKIWTLLASGTNELQYQYDYNKYTDLEIILTFGGVWTTIRLASHMIPIDGTSRIAFLNYYGDSILVEYSITSAKMTRYPAGYPTITMWVYAR